MKSLTRQPKFTNVEKDLPMEVCQFWHLVRKSHLEFGVPEGFQRAFLADFWYSLAAVLILR